MIWFIENINAHRHTHLFRKNQIVRYLKTHMNSFPLLSFSYVIKNMHSNTTNTKTSHIFCAAPKIKSIQHIRRTITRTQTLTTKWTSGEFRKLLMNALIGILYDANLHDIMTMNTIFKLKPQNDTFFSINKQTNTPTNHSYIASPNSDSTTSATLIYRTIISGWVLHVQIQLMNRRVHSVRAVVTAPTAVVVVVPAVEMHLWAVKWSIIQPIYHQLACWMHFYPIWPPFICQWQQHRLPMPPRTPQTQRQQPPHQRQPLRSVA